MKNEPTQAGLALESDDVVENAKTPELPPDSDPVKEVVENIPDEFTPLDASSTEETDQNTILNESSEASSGLDDTFLSPSGEVFNPEIHISKDKINKDGSFKRKRQRKTFSQDGAEIPDVLPPENNACAVTCVYVFEQIGCSICGEDFKANPNEKAFLTNTLQRYFDEKDIQDLPAGVAVAIAFTSFTVAKLQQETCKQKARPFLDKVKEKLFKCYSFFRNLFKRK